MSYLPTMIMLVAMVIVYVCVCERVYVLGMYFSTPLYMCFRFLFLNLLEKTHI